MWNSGIKIQIVLVIPKSLCLKHLVPWWVEMGNVTVDLNRVKSEYSEGVGWDTYALVASYLYIDTILSY